MSFSLSQTFLASYEGVKPNFGFNGLGEIVYDRTYARIKPDGTREKWIDTIRRIVEGLFNYQKKFLGEAFDAEKATKSAEEAFDGMFNLKFLPGGRVIWTAGTSIAEKSGMCLYNCSYVSTSTIEKTLEHPFVYLMDLMMHGVGVGFDVLGEDKIMIHNPTMKERIIIISDDREGWVMSLGELLKSYFIENSDTVIFDYSKIREKGLPLKSFGGISSGAEPLKTLHRDIRSVLEKHVDKRIDCRVITDIMNMIGVCVVAGNCRRCLHENTKVTTDKGLIDIKDVKIGTNVLTLDGYKEVYDVFHQGVRSVMKVTTYTGEIIYCTPEHKFAVKHPYKDYIWKQAKDLVMHSDELFIGKADISGHETMLPCNINLDTDSAWLVGILLVCAQYIDDSTISILLHDNKTLITTLNTRIHEYFKISNQSGDDICGSRKLIYDSKPFATFVSNIGNSLHQLLKASKFSKYSFISGIVDARLLDNTHRICLAKSTPQYAHLIHMILLSCNVDSVVSSISDDISNIHVTRDTLYHMTKYCVCEEKLQSTFIATLERMILPARKNTTTVFNIEYMHETANTYDLSVRDNHQFYANCILVSNSAEIAGGHIKNTQFLDLKNYEKNPERASIGWTSNNTVMANVGDDYKDIAIRIRNNGEPGIFWTDNAKNYSRMCDPKDYVDHRAMFTNPCSEITLEDGETCNLVEVFIANCGSLREFLKVLRISLLLAKSVTLPDVHWPITNKIIKRNRRIGISVSGVVQFLASRNMNMLREWLTKGYAYLKVQDEKISSIFGIPTSIKLTCVKPSGTVSLVAGSTPGIHFPISRFYIRRVRIAKSDKIMERIKDMKYPYESCALGTDNYVVEIPVDAGTGIKCDPSMFEQLMLTEFLQRYWADNQVSSTVTFDPETEGDKIEWALDYYQFSLKSISFLPKSKNVYPQMPYEVITEDEYKNRMKMLSFDIKISRKRPREEEEDEKDPMLYCDSERCMM